MKQLTRIGKIRPSGIYEMNRISAKITDVLLLSWAKPTYKTPKHIREAAINAIRSGKVGTSIKESEVA